MTRCYIGIGGNQGKLAETFAMALKSLDSLPGMELQQTSANYRSSAMGSDAGDTFTNAVAEFETTLEPHAILQNLQKVESQFGRDRAQVWGPRTLDLDLLYLGDLEIREDDLVLPHPHAWYRRFVLVPLCEIAPDFLHPVYKQSQAEFLRRIDLRPLEFQLIGCDIYSETLNDITREFADVKFDAPFLPDPETGIIVCGKKSTGVGENTPAVELNSLPGNDLESLKSVLQATMGTCSR